MRWVGTEDGTPAYPTWSTGSALNGDGAGCRAARSSIRPRPTRRCTRDHWFYSPLPEFRVRIASRSSRTCITTRSAIAGLMMNLSPDMSGRVPDEHRAALQAAGRWASCYGADNTLGGGSGGGRDGLRSLGADGCGRPRDIAGGPERGRAHHGMDAARRGVGRCSGQRHRRRTQTHPLQPRLASRSAHRRRARRASTRGGVGPGPCGHETRGIRARRGGGVIGRARFHPRARAKRTAADRTARGRPTRTCRRG